MIFHSSPRGQARILQKVSPKKPHKNPEGRIWILRSFSLFDEFDIGECGSIPSAVLVFEYPGIPACSIGEPVGNILKELMGGTLVSQKGKGPSPRVQIILLSQGNYLVHRPAQFFSFGFGCTYSLVLNQLVNLIAKERLSMARGSVQLST